MLNDNSVYAAIFIRQSKMGRIMLCPPSVCPSVDFPCPLHNSDTVQDIFMKHGTNINYHQTMYREQESTLHLPYIFYLIMAL